MGYPITMREFNARFNGVPAAKTWEILREELPFQLPEGFNDRLNAEIHRRQDSEITLIPTWSKPSTPLTGRVRWPRPPPGAPEEEPGIHRPRAAFRRAHLFRKPGCARQAAPDVFLFAASQLGVDPAHALVIEDSVAGVTAAMRAGMRVVGFAGANHGAEDLPDRLAKAGALTVIERMAELPRIVADLRA